MSSAHPTQSQPKCPYCTANVAPDATKCPSCGMRMPVPIVSPSEAAETPYPYLHVNYDGSVRELTSDERSYLETPFDMFDGARPYVKGSYEQKDGWGDLSGFCHRSAIPTRLSIIENPVRRPMQLWNVDEFIAYHDQLDLARAAEQDATAPVSKPTDRRLFAGGLEKNRAPMASWVIPSWD